MGKKEIVIMKNKRVITYGTFDLFHIGHLNLFKKLKKIGDYLIVGVSTDEFNAIKGKKAFFPFKQRFEIIKNITYVDLVIPETSWEQKKDDIKKYKVDIFAIGNDWEGRFDFLKQYCEVMYLPRTRKISSSDVRNILDSINDFNEIISTFRKVDLSQIKKLLFLLEQLKKDLK